MKVINGSATAAAWIHKLKSSGHLVDLYDLERIAGEKSDDLPIETSDLECFDEEYGTSYRNHLLAVFIDEDVDTQELIKLYPPLAGHFGSENLRSHLLFINLMMQSIMVVKLIGRGRTGSVMLPNLDADLEKFTEFDHASVVSRLTAALESIADSDYNMVYSEIDEGQIQLADKHGPNSDGMYLVGTHGDEGEGITLDELNQAKYDLENYKDSLDDGLYVFKQFFPLRKIAFENFAADY
jgi:hypothetical protein